MRNRPDPHSAALLADARDRLAHARGPRFWRSLEELAGTEEFQTYLHREFPEQASEWTDPASRRQFLRIMAASLALAGVTGCGVQAPEAIVPFVQLPEGLVPGKPLFYASALPFPGGRALGVLVETHEGRPTKVEGNPAHPASLGATDPFAQAAVLSLYDPDRSQVVTHNGRISTWNDFLGIITELRKTQAAKKGAGLRLLTTTVTSPTLAARIQLLLKDFPDAKWHQFEPVNRDNARAGAKLAFGEDVEPIHHMDKADIIVSLDADFLAWNPARIPDARQFATRREGKSAQELNRLYVAEPCPSITGAMADHRMPTTSRDVQNLAQAIARDVGIAAEIPQATPHKAWLAAAVADLKAHKGRSLVLAGEGQPPLVHALVHAINAALENVGKTISYIAPVEAEPVDQTRSLQALAADMEAKRVDVLFILGGNPVYDAPADLRFRAALTSVSTSIHLSLHEDETSELCEWHLPEAHVLESWGDTRAFDGTVSLQQPMILPLYDGKTALDVVSALLGQMNHTNLDVLREHWKEQHREPDFETFWKQSLHDGVIAGTKAATKAVTLKTREGGFASSKNESRRDGVEILFRPDPTVWDGRFANNGWLQELPKPITKLTWGNAALIAEANAKEFKLSNEDVIEIKLGSGSVLMPVWIMPGHAAESITLLLGNGRARAGRVGDDAGVNVYPIRTTETLWSASGATLRKTGDTAPLATTQHHQNMEGRDLIRVTSISESTSKHERGSEAHTEDDDSLTLHPILTEKSASEHAWGMAINLNACIGCSTCTIACQAENNIPVVGKEQVIRGRAMHWIRVDRYWEGAPDNPATYHQPVPCMHCETAPCEVVCPVGATNHDNEGLNVMVYNRCVGTRYCSNNCPYKVRRFNFLQFSDQTTEVLKMLSNPDVTVRTRGVMEKCTYCVQRINGVRHQAEVEGRAIGRDEVVPACAQACPTQAIVFGDLNDKESSVSKLKASNRNYGILTELNTRPRTTYLAKLHNPNAALETEQEPPDGQH
jgi:molybdopterin-containing oxidoreductase family iron-sulfur binding subunit